MLYIYLPVTKTRSYLYSNAYIGECIGTGWQNITSMMYGSHLLKQIQPVLHDWCNKGRGMYYPVCGMMHIKEPLLLIVKSSPCGGSGFPLSLSKWSFTIWPTPYNRK